ncbi:MAG: glycosyltransferase [Demequinaceae bacterium]|nr:glycosyltransferase [Demequinaceae bacterium]
MALNIIMPFWGDPVHLREAVDSVSRQEDPDWTLLILDDVYPDLAPGEWVKGLDDPRITYVRNEENLGPSRNYSKGVGLVDGEFVVVLGCDDRLLPGYVGRVKELIELFPEAGLVQPGVRVIDENGTVYRPLADKIKGWIGPKGPFPLAYEGESIAVSLLRGNWTYFPSLVWRRSLVKEGFRADLNVVQDLAKILEIILSGGAVVVDDVPVFEYRRHSQSVSAKTAIDASKYAQELTLFTEIASQSRARGWRRAARASSWHTTSRLSALSVVPAALKAGRKDGARALLRHAFVFQREPR